MPRFSAHKALTRSIPCYSVVAALLSLHLFLWSLDNVAFDEALPANKKAHNKSNKSQYNGPGETYCNQVEKESNVTHLKTKSMLLLHIGKAGGGTVRYSVMPRWKLWFPEVHPHPPITITRNKFGKEYKAVMITLRDPVDRFVSAFYWRNLVLCDPRGDTRKESRRAATKNPDKFCRTNAGEREMDILFYRYRENINEFSEALCSTNETIAKVAAEDTNYVLHLEHSITDWLGSNLSSYSYEDTLFPIVLEHGFDFVSQANDAIRWSYNSTHFENETAFQEREKYALSRHDCEKKEDTSTFQHTSTSSSKNTKLSEANVKCVANFYASDYKLLFEIKNTFCRTSTCREAITSILKRRAPFSI